HDEPALRAKGRGADNVERQAGLHAEQTWHEVKQEMTDEGRNHEAEQRPANPLRQRPARGASFGSVLPKDEPQEDARIGRGGVFVPGRTVALGIGNGARDVSRQLANWLSLLIIHS